MLGNINFRFIEWQYGIRPPTTLPVAAGNDNIDFHTIICTAQKKIQQSDIRICPQNIKIELNLLVLTLQDHWLESTFCKLGVPSSMFSQCPILGLSKFPPDHQSFAKGTLSLQDHKNTQYAITCYTIKLELQKKNNRT